MKKLLITVAALTALFAAGCSSLPDGARKMTLNIDSVSIANKNNVEGFKVDYTVHHSSIKPMPVEAVKIRVDINGRNIGNYYSDRDRLLEGHKDLHLSTFVPADKATPVASQSFKLTPMLQVQAVATVELVVEEDESDAASAFNVSSTYKGIIHASAN